MSTHAIRTPRTLSCPHCNNQMNYAGPGAARGTCTYICPACVPALQLKTLLAGQVVRTGAQGFAFVQLAGMPDLGNVRFEHADFVGTDLREGDFVLVLLEGAGRHARKVWKTEAVARPQNNCNGAGNTHPASNGRLTGYVSALLSPFSGRITVGQKRYFVHQKDVRNGGTLQMGQRMSFLPADTPRGPRACDVYTS